MSSTLLPFVVSGAEISVERRGKVPTGEGHSMRDWGAKHIAHQSDRSNTRAVTEAEVRCHCTADDLWVVVDGVVYDCSEWQRFHPGGAATITACGGRDATAVFRQYHQWVSCEAILKGCAIGRLVK